MQTDKGTVSDRQRKPSVKAKLDRYKAPVSYTHLDVYKRQTLNLKDVRIFDYIEDEEGKKKAVLNKKETAIAQAQQELIKQGFQDWIWADPARREKLTKMYRCV